ncbi:MAG: metallophosphoesterase [Clostridia bacterium]|nr:metallophosphoesterase [Clostridia bacterium]
MKNLFTKAFAVILALVLMLGVLPVCFAADDGTTAKSLRFGSDGRLRIMHITDTHLSADNIDDSVWLIGLACDREKPDVIMLTGDITMADTVEETCRRIDLLMNVFEQRNIPVAVTFGNHDSESGVISREDLMAYYNTFNCSISVDDGELLPGCGTYNIPVLGYDSDDIKFNLWVFDSGDYDSEDHYANVLEQQVQWYTEKSEELENTRGEKVYSLAFQHIIVPEVYEALKQVKLKGAYTYEHIYNKGEYYQFDPNVENRGMLHEYPCPGYYNHGQFEAMAQRGDVLALFTGHDHSNAFSVRYKNIDITNSLSTRYNADAFSTNYGYRMIFIDENETDKYETKVVHWYDFFDSDYTVQLMKAHDEHINKVHEIRFLGFFEKAAREIGIFFVQMFTGRTVRYPD